MSRLLLIATLPVFLATGAPTKAEDLANPSAAIRSVLVAQGEAWNRGDLQGYLASFARGEQTRHVFNDEITVGYPAIAARFRSRYPDASNMGRISFSNLEITSLAPDAAVAFANWTFEHDGRSFAGLFTLIFRRIDRRWFIVHDHSSAFPSA